jgi:hypothetical protein
MRSSTRVMFLLLLIVAVMASRAQADWVGPASDEYKPQVCPLGVLTTAVRCTGSFCDNIFLGCFTGSFLVSGRTWENFISEESPNNFKYCYPGFITGVACKGSYCDNISVECSSLTSFSSPGPCFWTGYFSEEQGGQLTFPTGYYAAGVQCSGRYCDNMRFYACRLSG